MGKTFCTLLCFLLSIQLGTAQSFEKEYNFQNGFNEAGLKIVLDVHSV